MEGNGNFLKNLVGDLLTLEINTILKENTTNTSMSATRRMALLDIAMRYRSKLAEYNICKMADGTPPPTLPPTHAPMRVLRWHFAGEYSFNEIRSAAQYGGQIYALRLKEMEKGGIIDEKRQEMLANRLAMLTRIERQSSNLVGLFKTRRKRYDVETYSGQEGYDGYENEPAQLETFGEYDVIPSQLGSHVWNNDMSIADINEHEDLELSPDEITQIRKIWEIGTQQVLLQTVIQIDGDMTSYITKQFVSYPEEVRSMLLGIHNQSINSATGFWKSLFSTVTELVGSAFSRKKPGKK